MTDTSRSTLPPEPLPVALRDAESLAEALTETVAAVARRAGDPVPDYARAKARAVAGFALMLGEAWAAGLLDADEMRAELAELERMMARYLRTMGAFGGAMRTALADAVGALLLRAIEARLGPSGPPLPRPGDWS